MFTNRHLWLRSCIRPSLKVDPSGNTPRAASLPSTCENPAPIFNHEIASAACPNASKLKPMDELKNQLHSYLTATREAVLWKAEALSDYDLTRPLVPSGSNIVGIIQHLACVEFGYFVECFGQQANEPLLTQIDGSDEMDADMWVPAHIPTEEILEFYRRAISRANENILALDLAAPVTVPWWSEEKRNTTLGRLLIHMNVETARHAGHLDIIRELIDGSIGNRKVLPNLPPHNPEGWVTLRQKIQHAAESR